MPDSFRFALKGWQAITHINRLTNAEKETDDFLAAASGLGVRLGPILFQLPPSMTKDIPKLDTFLTHVAGRAKVAFEFRNESWFGDELYDCLRAHSAALCIADDMPLVRTTDWSYMRLGGGQFTDERLSECVDLIWSHWDESYVFFMQEEAGLGPKLAARFLELAQA